MTDTLTLGNVAKDRITGYRGILVSRTTWLYGCVRYTIKSTELFEGKPIRAETYDAGQVEFIDAGMSVPWRDEPDVLGRRIRDKVTQLEGICTAYTQNLFGGDEIVLSPQQIKDSKPADSLALLFAQIEIREPVIAPERPARPPGGPRDEPRVERNISVHGSA